MDTARHLTWFNRILLTVFVAGGVWCIVEGVWWFGVVLIGSATVLGIVIWRAMRGRGSDTTRLDAVQPFDEREQAASTWSFAVVGRTSIVALICVFVGQAATREGRVDVWIALSLVLVCVVWGVAIRVAVRKV